MMTLYVATSNPGKLRDFAAAAGPEVTLTPLPGLAEIAPPPEDADTFAGNAAAKAIYYSAFASGAVVLADDSGLAVDALAGAPGVRSARYAEDHNAPTLPSQTIDERNNACLLAAMANVPENQRRGRYLCALAAARDGAVLHVAEGAVEGEILTAAQGTGGFGYDPLFYLPALQRTMAEIDLHEKIRFSHRGNALRALLPLLTSAKPSFHEK